MSNPIIIGAGLSGLIAASLIPNSTIIERNAVNEQNHRALLRFRTAAVGDALGIPFREVTVRKGIWSNGAFRAPTIALANEYSQKVLGQIADRSIWNLKTAKRFIAPENLADQLIERLGTRVHFGQHIETFDDARSSRDVPLISSAPMGVNLRCCSIGHDQAMFKSAPIHVRRWRIPNCDVHQTVYFPDWDTPLYRASITGDLLIAEYAEKYMSDQPSAKSIEEHGWLQHISEAFSLPGDIVDIDESHQRYGKIASIDNAVRKRLIHHMTIKHNVYSLGRFATWRNILLDDVLNDVYVIKKLLNASEYDAARLRS